MRERDIRDFWLASHPKEADKLISKAEQKNLKSKEVYPLQVERVPKKEVKAIEKMQRKKQLQRSIVGLQADMPLNLKS